MAEATIRPGLKVGDCFAHAFARTAGLSLLLKGGDLTQTEVTPVV